MGKLLALLLVAASIAGCATKSAGDVSDDTVEIIPGSARGADVLVLFLNRQTLLYNGDLAHDRMRVIRARLKTAGCREPNLVREHAEEQDGTWSFGRKRVLYYSDWTCG